MPDHENRGSLGVGIGVGFLLTLGGLVVSIASLMIGGAYLLMGFGVVQMLWIGPACAYFFKKGQTKTGQGLLIMAGICALLNATCWGAVLSVNH